MLFWLEPKVKTCYVLLLGGTKHPIDSPDDDYLNYYQLLKGIDEIIYNNLEYLKGEYVEEEWDVARFSGIKQMNDNTYMVLFD